jgi:hypothetical protein
MTALSIKTLSVTIQNFYTQQSVKLNVIIVSVAMLSVIMLNFVMLNVVMTNVIMLNVKVPVKYFQQLKIPL